jgi:hypothetical protein
MSAEIRNLPVELRPYMEQLMEVLQRIHKRGDGASAEGLAAGTRAGKTGGY